MKSIKTMENPAAWRKVRVLYVGATQPTCLLHSLSAELLAFIIQIMYDLWKNDFVFFQVKTQHNRLHCVRLYHQGLPLVFACIDNHLDARMDRRRFCTIRGMSRAYPCRPDMWNCTLKIHDPVVFRFLKSLESLTKAYVHEHVDKGIHFASSLSQKNADYFVNVVMTDRVVVYDAHGNRLCADALNERNVVAPLIRASYVARSWCVGRSTTFAMPFEMKEVLFIAGNVCE